MRGNDEAECQIQIVSQLASQPAKSDSICLRAYVLTSFCARPHIHRVIVAARPGRHSVENLLHRAQPATVRVLAGVLRHRERVGRASGATGGRVGGITAVRLSGRAVCIAATDPSERSVRGDVGCHGDFVRIRCATGPGIIRIPINDVVLFMLPGEAKQRRDRGRVRYKLGGKQADWQVQECRQGT